MVLAVFGILVVLFGAADVMTRLAHATFGSHSNAAVFGPAIVSLAQSSSTPTFISNAAPLSPARLIVSSVGINAVVEHVGKKADGSMATPSSFTTVAWYELGAAPGAPGNTVIDGHVNNALTKAGVFEHLNDLKLGDVIVVTDAQGRQLRYAVRDIEDYASDSAPQSQIFATEGPSQLVLITCAGDWDPKAHSYDHRLVIFAGLLASQ
jgi:LPXTG-site transpeptidase (sortase) family protein